jgi:hypothetical protein
MIAIWTRHCERSEAIQTISADGVWIASSLQRKIASQFCRGLLAMTTLPDAHTASTLLPSGSIRKAA